MSSARRKNPARVCASHCRTRRSHYPNRLRLWLKSDRGALCRAVERIVSFSRKGDCLDPDGHTDLEISLCEALANAINHGNAGEYSKRIFLRCYGSPQHGLVVLVRDQGQGFDPADIPDPRSDDRKHLAHGRGLFLMRQLMDRVEFRRGGREVMLYRGYRPAEAG